MHGARVTARKRAGSLPLPPVAWLRNSSLAAGIGYPEMVSLFAGTVLNQTGQAIEVIAITMSVYLAISISISLLMNWYNKRIALIER